MAIKRSVVGSGPIFTPGKSLRGGKQSNILLNYLKYVRIHQQKKRETDNVCVFVCVCVCLRSSGLPLEEVLDESGFPHGILPYQQHLRQ
jgi:hypothetical protein